MPKKEYDWTNGPATLEPHSRAKYTILRRYVEEYLRILTINGKVPEFRVTLVDGFAGGGEYVVKGGGGAIHDGSPIILIGAVNAATAHLNTSRKKPLNIDANFVFVEKNASAHNYLEKALHKKFEPDFIKKKVSLIHGAFENHVWDIVKNIQSVSGRKPRPIFILDQYGYSKIPVDMIAGIMQALPTAEVFLTLAVDYIADYSSDLSDAYARLESSLHIDTSHVKSILDGRKDLEEIEMLSEGDRHVVMQQIQWLLHEAFARKACALYYTPFFITSASSRKSYWFLHLANNYRANDVVKQLHWEVANHFEHHCGAGIDMMVLGVDPSRPPTAQRSFDFGDSAQQQTVEKLLKDLPARLRHEKYRNGVSISDLYADLGNGTPASIAVLKKPLKILVSCGELERVGAHQEQRHLTTDLQDNDIVRPAKAGLLFSLTDLRSSDSKKKT